MKSCKAFLGLILMAVYIFNPGNVLAFANHVFHDKGLPIVECLCCTETEKNSTHNPLSENGDESDLYEHDCNCSSHLPSVALTLTSSNEFACLLPGETTQLYPMVYIPIFVPPQNLV
jgi:hypothetical protein